MVPHLKSCSCSAWFPSSSQPGETEAGFSRAQDGPCALRAIWPLFVECSLYVGQAHFICSAPSLDYIIWSSQQPCEETEAWGDRVSRPKSSQAVVEIVFESSLIWPQNWEVVLLTSIFWTPYTRHLCSGDSLLSKLPPYPSLYLHPLNYVFAASPSKKSISPTLESGPPLLWLIECSRNNSLPTTPTHQEALRYSALSLNILPLPWKQAQARLLEHHDSVNSVTKKPANCRICEWGRPRPVSHQLTCCLTVDTWMSPVEISQDFSDQQNHPTDPQTDEQLFQTIEYITHSKS